jgi:RecJ-like exonuclease
MSGPFFPGYDAWKLASPPEYDTEDACQMCEGTGELNIDQQGECPNCGGTGRVQVAGMDLDYARDLAKESGL